MNSSQDLDRKEDIDHAELSPPVPATVVSHFAQLTVSQAMRKFWRLYIIGFSVSFIGIYVGYAVTLPGSIVANQGFIDVFGTVRDPVTGALSLSATWVSIWGGTVYAVQICTQILSPLLADRFGLKPNMYLLTVLIALSIVVEIVSKTVQIYFIAKILAGCATGLIGTTIMTYASEITLPQFRGVHLSVFALSYALGQLFVAIALQILESTTPLLFRRAFYSEFAVLGIWLPVLLFLPESPSYLCKKGQAEKAKKAMLRLVGRVEGYNVDHEYKVLEFAIEESRALIGEKTDSHWMQGWLACFKGANLRRTLVSTIPFTFQNFSGVPLVFGYTTYFFSLAGLSNTFLANLIIYIVLLVGVICSFFLVDKVGRRPLLIYGGAILALSCFAIGGLGSVPTSSKTGSALIAISCIWVFAYSLSLAPLGWLFLVEISTPQLRAKTAGIAAMLQSLSGVLFNYTVPLMLSNQGANWGVKIGYFFGAICAAFLALTWLTVPETKGRSSTDLDELFERRIPAWRFKYAKTSAQELAEQEAAELRA